MKSGLCFLALLVLDLAAFVFVRTRPGPALPMVFGMALINGMVFLMAVFAYKTNDFLLARYPIELPFVHNLRRGEEEWKKIGAKATDDWLSRNYPAEPSRNEFRVLFLGTSQTQGSGAKWHSEKFTRVIEEKAKARKWGRTLWVNCINASVGGNDSSQLREYYANSWIKFNPQITIVNLSNNNRWAPQIDFGADLQRIIDIGNSRGVRTVFVLEPNAPDYDEKGIRAMHDIMRRVAEKNGMTVLDAHEFFRENRNRGMIWWDVVHFTSFGHEMMADYLYDYLEPFMESYAASLK